MNPRKRAGIFIVVESVKGNAKRPEKHWFVTIPLVRKRFTVSKVRLTLLKISVLKAALLQ
ncbi:hypothetical protein GF360_01805 [candidate division WWE3 bacterium]|nr:hypothetical protein [candidate division WWE3 bacterium]